MQRTLSLGILLAVAVCNAQAHDRVGERLQVPAEFPSIQAAVDAARSGDEIRIAWKEKPYIERVVIRSERLRSLSLVGDPEGEHPIIAVPGQDEHAVIELHNEANLPFEIEIKHLIVDGLGWQSHHGIKLYNEVSPNRNEVYNKLTIEDCIIGRCLIGIEVGTRTGTQGCEGHWGAADRNKLSHSRTELHVLNTIVYGMARDGLNLYRVSGELTGSLIFYNLDEGVHTTDARDFSITNCIFTDNGHITLHHQLCENAPVRNNVIARGVRAQPGYGGYGVVIGGTFSDTPVPIENNLIAHNIASGLRVQAAEVRVDEVTCVPVSAKVEARNNVLFSNAWGEPDSLGLDYQVFFQKRSLPGMRLICEHNIFRADEKLVWGIPLDQSNLRGVDPLFVAEPDSAKFEGVTTLAEAWSRLAGYELVWPSPAIDAGDPRALFEDAGGLAKGTRRNDIGIFGGPQAIWPFLAPDPKERVRDVARDEAPSETEGK